MDDANDVQIQPLLDRLDAMLAHFERPSQANSLVQTSHFGGFATGVSIASCVATVTLMLAFLIVESRSYAHLDAQIDQLKAWNDVNRAKIAELQAKLNGK